MKAELKAKFLQHLNQKKKDEGFTLIELLVVIIIIGILSAIALPSFLNQANKGKQSEAKTYVGSLNRGQQAYFLENNAFASTITQVGIGIQTQTANYYYNTVPGGGGTGPNAYTVNFSSVVSSAPLRNYGGKVYISTTGSSSDATSLAFLCESTAAGGNANNDLAPSTVTSCPSNWNQLGK